MKIAILSYYSGTVERGVENWAAEVAARLPKQVSVFSAANTGRPFALKVLPRLLKNHFDIVIPTGGRLEAVLVRLLCFFTGSKVLIFSHSGRGWDDRLNLYTFPDAFVAFSRPAVAWAKSINPFIKIYHIPVGIDLSKFKATGPAAKLNLHHPIILCNAAAIASKQIDLTIKAVARLPKASLLVLSNSGDQTESLKRLGRGLLGPRFLMLKVPHDQVAGYYRAADIFTLASWANESFPIVYLEAMASSLPIVATDNPIRHEMIGPAGLFVDPHDIQAYADQLQKALDTDWGEKPRRQSEKYAWDNIIGRYETLCQELTS